MLRSNIQCDVLKHTIQFPIQFPDPIYFAIRPQQNHRKMDQEIGSRHWYHCFDPCVRSNFSIQFFDPIFRSNFSIQFSIQFYDPICRSNFPIQFSDPTFRSNFWAGQLGGMLHGQSAGQQAGKATLKKPPPRREQCPEMDKQNINGK